MNNFTYFFPQIQIKMRMTPPLAINLLANWISTDKNQLNDNCIVMVIMIKYNHVLVWY